MNKHNKSLADAAIKRKQTILAKYKKMKASQPKLSFTEFGVVVGVSRQRVTKLLKEAELLDA